ncbi:hypothetical protein [Halegenticoccus tardaugens]|uniref:hypothetical protein n=1 Tax=Halegenticoccus tardaugens TaxID=2071624 RepID=UPI0013E93C23|nr:hypothetical protein [Halegenticoccus tardaugens]
MSKMDGHQQIAAKSECRSDAHEEMVSENISDERTRAIVAALKANGGELQLSELTDEVIKRERTSHQWAPTDVVPAWVYTLVSGGGVVSILGSYLKIGVFATLSVSMWTGVTFGLLLTLSVSAAIAQRRNQTEL